jgi:hypothetical protein
VDERGTYRALVRKLWSFRTTRGSVVLFDGHGTDVSHSSCTVLNIDPRYVECTHV